MKLKKFSTGIRREAFLFSKLAEVGVESIKDEAFIEPAFIGDGSIETFDDYREAAAVRVHIPGWLSCDELFGLTEHLLRRDYAQYKALHEHVE